ncbi:hypothetical protein ACKVMT_13900 [Halobacteriales archaeon Cl-PHB]
MEERRLFQQEYDRVALLDAATWDQKLNEVLEDANLTADLANASRSRSTPGETDEGGREPDRKNVARNGQGASDE